MEATLQDFNPERAAVDSITTYTIFMEMLENIGALMGFELEDKNVRFDRELLVRLSVIKLFDMLKSRKITAMVCSEHIPHEAPLNIDRISRTIGDGVISIEREDFDDECFGLIQVQEMRLSRHSRKAYMLHISERGLMVGTEAKASGNRGYHG
jgi:KaiC/GvpD/RAD55 family RecA-like ATPase